MPTRAHPTRSQTKDVFMKSIPLGRLSEPSDIAASVCFLASDEAAFITGVDLGADVPYDVRHG
jgi:3-oxoacyl-[acyl-carrier protein] reductase